MLPAVACTSRLTVAILIGCSISLLLALYSFSESFQTSWNRPHKPQEHSSPPSHGQIYYCEDPYRRPGYLHTDAKEYKNTRWIPYTKEFLNADAPVSAEYPPPEGQDLSFNATDVEPDILNSMSNPQQWMRMAIAEETRRRNAVQIDSRQHKPADFVSMKEDGDLGWLWGRRVLILGDSVDRFMIQYFCDEFGRGMRQPKLKHTTATCAIPTLNFTLIHWHFPGVFTYRPKWWWMGDMDTVAFEERWEEYWEPMLDTTVRGLTGQPDLVLWQNGLWDQRALWEAGKAHHGDKDPMSKRERQMVWQEIRFVAARVKKFVKWMGDLFGPNVPVMFRTLTTHRESNAIDANLYELDRLSRTIAEDAGHEVFEWGRILTGFSMLYKDKTHTGKGPGSWLWGNMILEYLARSAGKGDPDRWPYFESWDACHPHLANWGGR